MIPFAVLHYYRFDPMGGYISLVRYICGDINVVDFENNSYYEQHPIYDDCDSQYIYISIMKASRR